MLPTSIQTVTAFFMDVQADTGLVESVSNWQGAYLLLTRVLLTKGPHPTRLHRLHPQ